MSITPWVVGGRQVREVMTREVLSVRGDARLTELAALFSRSGFDLIPVVATGMLLEGVVTRTDLLAHLLSARSPRGLAQRRGGPVSALLRRVVPLGGADRLAKAARRLALEGLSALPVADGDGRLRGILSRADLLRHAGVLCHLPAGAHLPVGAAPR